MYLAESLTSDTGEREALELRDGDKGRYGGKGVRKAVGNVNGEIGAPSNVSLKTSRKMRPCVNARGSCGYEFTTV